MNNLSLYLKASWVSQSRISLLKRDAHPSIHFVFSPSSLKNRKLYNWEDKDLNLRVKTQRPCLVDQPGARSVPVRSFPLIWLLDLPLDLLACTVWAPQCGAWSSEHVLGCLLFSDSPTSFITTLKHENPPNTRYAFSARKKTDKRHKANSGLLGPIG